MHVATPAVAGINDAWCHPPLPALELSALVRHAMTAPDHPNFLARHRPDDIEHDAEVRR